MNNQDTNIKIQTNNNISNSKFDLEDRTLEFSKTVIRFCKILPRNIINTKIVDKLVRSGTSIGANYREANDSLGKKDFILRVKIARKEAKETSYWLELIIEANPEIRSQADLLLQECQELRN